MSLGSSFCFSDYGDSCIESSQASKSELEEMDTAVVSVQSTQNENIGAENVKNETEVVEMEKPADNVRTFSNLYNLQIAAIVLHNRSINS